MPPGFKEALQKILDFAQANASRLSRSLKVRFAQFLHEVSQFMRKPAAPPAEAEGLVPDSARLLWVAAGGDANAFVNFLQQFPAPDLQEIAKNPTKLAQIIKALAQEMPQGEPEQEQDGVTPSWLPSSNVWGFSYDKNSKQLKVKFNGKRVRDAGPTYSYDNVPEEIVKIFVAGAIPAKTTGKNRWGTWWKGKRPSIAASFHEMIKQGGYRYRKVA